jgi:plasmid stabilization system protein ParE
MTLIILEDAEEEFNASVAYYESKEPGLGRRFRDEVAAALDWIAQNPEVPRLRSRGYRRVNLRVFSHYVAYVLRGDTLWVVAIAHAYRRPEFWLGRI